MNLASEAPTQQSNEALDRLVDYLASLEVEAPIVDYPVHRTVDEGKRLRGTMVGTFTKNLLLRDRKRRLFLFSVHEDRVLNLKTLHTHVGGSRQMSFASPEQMIAVLGVAPGAMTPMALMNDVEEQVTFVLDETLMGAEQINFHPMVQDKSIGLRPEQLLSFLDACNHQPVLLSQDV
ncbi:MAG: prolyl-tRNA synthetase associated domain-containing protein [Chloroflexota bacterium]|jgi:Ala-tRNA(Pro) deacylase|nr:prolyl-tRNA synthetase associated domain-containing protein [Chloroflexota bacterium]